MEKKLGFINRFITSPVNTPQNKIPVPGENEPLEGHRIADLPFESGNQFPPGHEAFTILDEGPQFLIRKDKFRINFHKTPGFHRQIGKEVLFVLVNAAEPGAIGNGPDPLYLTDFVLVGNGKGENEGDGIPGDQAGGG